MAKKATKEAGDPFDDENEDWVEDTEGLPAVPVTGSDDAGESEADARARERHPEAHAAEDRALAASAEKVAAAQAKAAQYDKAEPHIRQQVDDEVAAAEEAHAATEEQVKKARADRAKPDTLIGVLLEWLAFDNERMHREQLQRPGDAQRLTRLMTRLRALERDGK